MCILFLHYALLEVCALFILLKNKHDEHAKDQISFVQKHAD